MVTTLTSAELSSPLYNEVKTLVEETKDEVTAAMQIVEAKDRGRGLYTLQDAPNSLLEYPKFQGRDSRGYFQGKGYPLSQEQQGSSSGPTSQVK